MFEHETYTEKKWLERHGLREDPVYLRRAHSRVEDKQGRKHRSGEGAMNHLYDLQMTWWRHAKIAWCLSWKLFLLSLTALAHGMLPFTFSSTTSEGIKKIAHDMDQGNHT
jgi:putative exporter of polyketide antibiotics